MAEICMGGGLGQSRSSPGGLPDKDTQSSDRFGEPQNFIPVEMDSQRLVRRMKLCTSTAYDLR